jgi:hypothetical protein
MLILTFVPDSHHWLINYSRNEEALEIHAIFNAHGNCEDPLVLVQYKEITDTLRYVKERKLSLV